MSPTHGGEESFAWGKYSDAALLAIARRRANLPLMPFGWSWSPDGKFVFGGRVDERHIEPYSFLESVPQDGGAHPHAYLRRHKLGTAAIAAVSGHDRRDRGHDPRAMGRPKRSTKSNVTANSLMTDGSGRQHLERADGLGLIDDDPETRVCIPG